MLTSSYAAAAAGLVATLFGPVLAQSDSNLPIVDLGYELHQASTLNSSAYWFNNIRYAASPTGYNRFRAPQPPAYNRSTVQTGTPDRICPQAEPAWLLIASQYIPEYLAGQTVFNESSFNTSSSSSGLPAQDPRTTEDCLFLDVVVPESIYDNAGKGYGAPVLVWIYGGRIHRRLQGWIGQPCWSACEQPEQWR